MHMSGVSEHYARTHITEPPCFVLTFLEIYLDRPSFVFGVFLFGNADRTVLLSLTSNYCSEIWKAIDISFILLASGGFCQRHY